MGSKLRLASYAVVATAAACAFLSGEAVAGTQCGKAAWYDLSGKTASGERSNGRLLTAAHRTLPFGTKVKVENLGNGRAVIVRINDRGPYGGGRVIDLSKAAADKLGYIRAGVAKVRVSVVDGDPSDLPSNCSGTKPPVIEASLSPSDDVPEPRPKPSAVVEPVDELNQPVDALNDPPAEPGTAPTRERKRAIEPAVETEVVITGEPVATDLVITQEPAKPPPATKRPRGSVLAERFRDAFAPSDSFVVDTMALGYAGTDPR